MAAHPSVLAWRIPGTGEPGGLPSMGLHSVRLWGCTESDTTEVDLAAAAAGLTQGLRISIYITSSGATIALFSGLWMENYLARPMLVKFSVHDFIPLEFSLRCKFSFNRTDVGAQIL